MSIIEQDSYRNSEEMLLSLIRTGKNLCAYHIPRRQGIFPIEHAEKFGIPEVVDDFPELAVKIGQIAPQSKNDWLSMFADIESGSTHGFIRVFLRSTNGDYVRYWIRYNTIYRGGAPLIALITFDDITQEYERDLALSQDIDALIQSAKKSFSEVLLLNLTKGIFRVSSRPEAEENNGSVNFYPLEYMTLTNLNRIAVEDHENVKNFFSLENLRKAFIEDNMESLDLSYRRKSERGEALWYQTTIKPISNAMDNDVLLVVMSRSIDKEKAAELRLSNELWLLSEQIRVTTGQLSRTIFYYDIPTKTLTVPPDYAAKHNMPLKMPNYPESISIRFRRELPDTFNAIHRFYESILQGEPSGSCELAFNPKGGTASWKRWEYALVYDRSGKPSRAIIFVEDITDQHLQASEIKRLRSNEHFSRIIAQHSDRTVYFYDVAADQLRPWGEITSRHKSPTDGSPIKTLLAGEGITPDNPEILHDMFRDIQSGIPQGGMKVHATAPDDTSRWFDIRFSTIFSDENAPSSAVISVKDVTDQYEIELTYLRHLQAMETSESHLGLAEVDLHTGIIETQSGRMLPANVVAVGKHMSAIADHMLSLRLIHDSDRLDADRFFTTDFLTGQYVMGIRHLERVWEMTFHSGRPGWIRTEVDLVLDPYSQHRKAFFRLTDITREKNAELEMISRSEQDGMTGLLNRATTEERIKEHLEKNGHPGILILLDLDDLKGINDTFGHSEGDRAIRSIAETLKVHFREGDIIGRVGGDEFVAYLPGAADNQDAISASVSNLLRKLTRIPIGEDNQHRIHCSIGCTLEAAGDTFETIYKRADIALYNVKRSGKNNYAFYTAAMEESNQHFQEQRLLSQRSAKKANITELQYLLSALTDLFEAVVAFNLTSRDYFLLEEDRKGVFSVLPSYGTMEDFINITRMGIHPDDVASYMGWMTGDVLMQAYERGERSVRYYCRFFYEGSFKWVEVDIVFYVNEDGDLCDFTLLRWADERSHELDQLAVSKALELAVNSTFESIALIDIATGQYSRFGESSLGANVPPKKNYDEAIRLLRENVVGAEEQERYYDNAKLSNVVARMEAGNGSYSFCYTLSTGRYEASFDWLNHTHAQLFLTVRKMDKDQP